MAKMKKPWVALCSTAIGAIYAAGYFATDTQASMQQSLPLAQANTQMTSSPFPQQTPSPSPAASMPSAPASTPYAGTPTPGQSLPASSTAPPAASPKEQATQQPTGTPTPVRVQATAQPTTAPTPQKVQATPQPTSTPSGKLYKDGTFSGMGSNRRGSIQVAVTVKNDKITDVEITRFAMHYSERDVVGLPAEVVQLQSPRVPNVSGATYSTAAFEDAVQYALMQARNA